MDIYKVSDLARNNNGEYVLGSSDLHTHACYLIYGTLKGSEKGRVLQPGIGHEEIVCIVRGKVLLCGNSGEYRLEEGQAFHLRGEDKFLLDNMGEQEALYVISGGHSEGHRH